MIPLYQFPRTIVSRGRELTLLWIALSLGCQMASAFSLINATIEGWTNISSTESRTLFLQGSDELGRLWKMSKNFQFETSYPEEFFFFFSAWLLVGNSILVSGV